MKSPTAARAKWLELTWHVLHPMVNNYFADGVLPYAEVECLLIYNGYHDTQLSLRKVSDPQIPGTVTFTSKVLWDA